MAIAYILALSTVNNKTSLISFIVGEWRKPQYKERLHGKVLHSTANDKCYQITSQGSKEVTSLQCQQEEADGAYFSIPTDWSNVDLSR